LAILQPLTRENPAILEYANREAKYLQSLGWVQYASGNADKAAESFSAALAIFERITKENPQTLDPAGSAPWLLATCPVQRLRDPRKATTLARECLEREPQSGDALRALGVARFRAGDAKEAVDALEKALKQLPAADGSRILVELALVLARWQSGQQQAARELLDKTISGKPESKHPEYRALRDEVATLLNPAKPMAPGGPMR
jgi:tetratricopeptide (TPR) repeat protein